MSRLKDKYKDEIAPKLGEELQIKDAIAVPALKKIAINVGVGEAKDNQAVLDKVVENIAALSGQKPVIRRAKQSISGFKLSKGQPVGVTVTLRGERMYQFLDKLIHIVLPKVRDFRGVADKSFDNQGNFTLGLSEQAIFPEVAFQATAVGSKMRGLEISIITTAKKKEEGKRLLELLGMPFKGEGKN